MLNENVTDQYDYRWKFVGTSKIAGTHLPAVSSTKAGTIKTLSSQYQRRSEMAFEGRTAALPWVAVTVSGLWSVHRPTNANKLSSQHTTTPREGSTPAHFVAALSKSGLSYDEE